ncbi:hypothetical protein MHH60_20645 [Paenibacillus sp. FSL H7-0716]|nr:hypothetical protein [Paenibacillus odorifer]
MPDGHMNWGDYYDLEALIRLQAGIRAYWCLQAGQVLTHREQLHIGKNRRGEAVEAASSRLLWFCPFTDINY